MEHLFVHLPGRRVLLADVHRSADGQGVGYGMMLIRMRRVLVAAQLLRARVLFIPSGRALNTAVTRLQSDDPVIIDADSWTARALLAVWWLAAPFRVGDPWLWIKQSVARLVVGHLYNAVERSTRLPRPLRRFVLAQRPVYKRMKVAIRRHAARSDRRWQRLSSAALTRRAALKAAGVAVPPIRLRLPADREHEMVRAAAALGIDPSRPIVTVHVRESGYRSTSGLRQRRWDAVRNARIESFFDAFRALVQRGYTIVRLGDPTMTSVDMPGVVDLATSPARSEWLDIWCTMRSEFLIGCDSGPSWLAVLLGVPVLTVNAVHFRDLWRPADRIICKLARDRVSGNTLSVAEMLTPEFLRVGFKGDRYDFLDNTKNDLRRAAVDMIEVVHRRERRSSWQNRFNRRLHDIERQRLAGASALEGVAVMGHARGTLSRTFAKRYFAKRPSTARAPVS